MILYLILRNHNDMKNFVNLCFFALILLTVESCREQSAVQEESFLSYNVNWDSPKSIFEAMDEVELLVLEETPKSLIGVIRRILINEGHIFVLSNKSRGIFKFKITGEFVDKIEAVGGGPNEYRTLDDIVISGGALFGLDSKRQRVLKWSLDFDFLNSFKLGFWADRMIPLNEGFAFDSKFHLVQGSAVNLASSDRNFDYQWGGVPFEQARGLVLGGGNVFSKFANTVHYHPAFKDTVYKLNEASRKVEPVYRFEYGEFWKFNDQFKTDDELFTLFNGDSSNFDEMVLSSNFLESDEVILQSIVLFPSYLAVGVRIDKEKDEVLPVSFMLDSDVRNAINPIYLDGARIFASVNVDNLKLILDRREDLRTTLGKNNGENPVIISFKIK